MPKHNIMVQNLESKPNGNDQGERLWIMQFRCLQRSGNARTDVTLVILEESSHSEVGNLRIEIPVQQNVTCFNVPVHDPYL